MVIIDGGKLLVTTAIVCLVVMFFKEWRKTKQCEEAVTWWRLGGGGSFLIAMTLMLFIEKPTSLSIFIITFIFGFSSCATGYAELKGYPNRVFKGKTKDIIGWVLILNGIFMILLVSAIFIVR